MSQRSHVTNCRIEKSIPIRNDRSNFNDVARQCNLCKQLGNYFFTGLPGVWRFSDMSVLTNVYTVILPVLVLDSTVVSHPGDTLGP